MALARYLRTLIHAILTTTGGHQTPLRYCCSFIWQPKPLGCGLVLGGVMWGATAGQPLLPVYAWLCSAFQPAITTLVTGVFVGRDFLFVAEHVDCEAGIITYARCDCQVGIAPSCTLDLPSLMAEGGYTLDAAAAAELASRPAAADP